MPFTESHLEEAHSPAGFGSGENFWTIDFEFGRDKHFTVDRYAELIDVTDYFTFATVRNPWDWAVSLYYFRKQTHDAQQPHWVSEKPNDFGKAEFKRFLNAGELTQSSFLGHGRVPMHLLRFETIADDFRAVCYKLGLGNLVLDKINSSRRPRFQDVLDAELQLEIGEIYAEDIWSLGYSSFASQSP